MRALLHTHTNTLRAFLRNGKTLFLLGTTLMFTPVIFFSAPSSAVGAVATTTIVISICGDGLPNLGEVCDSGVAFNDGAYSSSTSGRRCNFNCTAYGPYCGDVILQALYSEQCDDGNNTDGDLCSNSCVQEAPPVSTTTASTTPPATPPPAGGNGGGGAFAGVIPVRAQTRVVLEGKAYPGASVNVLKDGTIVGVIQANANADFSYETSDVTAGATTFGFWATDSLGLRSITFTTTFQVSQNAVTTVSNVFLPPTIDLRSKKVRVSDLLDAFGATAPVAKVSLYVDKEKDPRVTATSSSAGLWGANIPALGLQDEAFHAVKAIFEQFGSGDQAKSGFSQALNFYVGQRDVATPKNGDLNGDGKVNLVDFSILLFHFGTDHDIADLNSDGRVNLTDFSILLFNWTG